MVISTINRYLVKETAVSFLAVVVILLAIIVGGLFVRLLGRVADGAIGIDVLLPMLGLSTISSLSVLMSVALFLAVMVTLGRLYVDSEITALQASGMSPIGLQKPFLMLGLVVAMVQAALSLQLEPWAERHYQQLKLQAARTLDLGGITPGRFVELDGGRVVYAERMNSETRTLERLYLFSDSQAGEDLILAREAGQVEDPDSGRKYLQLRDGNWFQENLEKKSNSVTNFGVLGLFLPGMAELDISIRPRAVPTMLLFGTQDLRMKAELQWRFSSPMMIMFLVALAVPLSHTSPRQGRFGSLGIAVVSCILYFNVLALAKNWMAKSITPEWIGIWWVHLMPVCLTLFLLWRRKAFNRFFTRGR